MEQQRQSLSLLASSPMALAQAVPGIPSSCSLCRSYNHSNNGDFSSSFPFFSGIGISRVCVGPHSRKANCAGNLNGRWRLRAVDTRIVQNAPPRSSVEIPVTCYQVIGVTDQAEKDEIVKSVMDLKNAEIEEGYSMDVVVSRQDLLMDVRDKLLFEPEYAGNVKEKIPPKSSLRVPWSWLPGALCLLQEVGEVKLVLDIGRVALQHLDAKPYIHDLLLSMALAEVLS